MMAVSVVPQNTQAAEPNEYATIIKGRILGIDRKNEVLIDDGDEEYWTHWGVECGEWEINVPERTLYIRGFEHAEYIQSEDDVIKECVSDVCGYDCLEQLENTIKEANGELKYKDSLNWLAPEYYQLVKNIIIEEGVTQCPEINGYSNIEYIKFPSTLKTMTNPAHDSELSIFIPKSVTNCVRGIHSWDTVYYEGTEDQFNSLNYFDDDYSLRENMKNIEFIKNVNNIVYNCTEDPTKPYVDEDPFDESMDGQEFQITYVLDGGTNNEKNPSSYICGEGVPQLYSPSSNTPGYGFDGWYTDKDFTNEIRMIDVFEHTDITLYAKWSLIKYGILYMTNKGKFKKNQEVIRRFTMEDEFTLPKPVRKGYKFKGWYLDKNFAKSSKITRIEKD